MKRKKETVSPTKEMKQRSENETERKKDGEKEEKRKRKREGKKEWKKNSLKERKKRKKEWKKKRGGNDEHNDAVVADHVLTVDVAFISHPPTIKTK